MIAATTISTQLAVAFSSGTIGYFYEAAEQHSVPVEILLAVASRETNMGTSKLLQGWRGDEGHAWGIMQIDRRYHPEFTQRHSPSDHKANIDYAANYLRSLKDQLGTWPQAVAAYNAGPGSVDRAVAEGRHPDDVTTGGDYASDVMQRAELIGQIVNIDFTPIIIAGGLGVTALLIAINRYRNS